MPVIFCEVYDDRYEHRESLMLVSFENVEEVVILEEAHGSISDLKMDTADAIYNPFKKPRDDRLYFVDFTNFKNFL